MSDQSISTIVKDILHRHANANAFTADSINQLKRELFSPKFPERAQMFRREFAQVILQEKLTPVEYEQITGEDFDTQEELNIWLRELWRDIFGDIPIQSD